MPTTFDKPSDLIGKEGTQFGPTDWLKIEQDRVNMFADATLDHQWIHIDVEKSKAGPFGTTIAHGYLTLSLVAALMFAQGSRLPTVLAATFGIHSAHNGSVYLLPFPTDLVALALNSFLRVSIFAAVIAYCLSELRKLEVLRTQSG